MTAITSEKVSIFHLLINKTVSTETKHHILVHGQLREAFRDLFTWVIQSFYYLELEPFLKLLLNPELSETRFTGLMLTKPNFLNEGLPQILGDFLALSPHHSVAPLHLALLKINGNGSSFDLSN